MLLWDVSPILPPNILPCTHSAGFKMVVWAVVLNFFWPAGWMGSTWSISRPDLANGPDLVSGVVLAGPYPTMHGGKGCGLTPTHPCGQGIRGGEGERQGGLTQPQPNCMVGGGGGEVVWPGPDLATGRKGLTSVQLWEGRGCMASPIQQIGVEGTWPAPLQPQRGRGYGPALTHGTGLGSGGGLQY